MTSVLVVDDDAPLRKALTRELRANGYESRPASGYEEAMQRLAEQAYDVLLTDLRMGDKDGLDLLLALSVSFPTTRPILMSGYATARDSERALDLGAVRVLCKPFDSAEMLQAVERAAECGRGFFGTVHGLSIVDMLQMFHYARRSVTLRVLGGMPIAIHMQSGQIVHATYGATQGEEALGHILTLPAGSLQTSSLEAFTAPSISREFQPLILDLLRCQDERQRGVVHVTGGSSLEPWTATLDAGLESVPALAESEPGLLTDACQRTVAQLEGDVVCGVVDLESGVLLGCSATRGDAQRRGEGLATATLALFRDGTRALGELSGDLGIDLEPVGQALKRVELTLKEGMYFARATRGGRRVLAVLAGSGADPEAARARLDAVFPLVEALAP
jgi:CheY-like chemotaxis protein